MQLRVYLAHPQLLQHTKVIMTKRKESKQKSKVIVPVKLAAGGILGGFGGFGSQPTPDISTLPQYTQNAINTNSQTSAGQTALINQLGQQASGQAPSLAGAQMNAAYDKSLQQQLAQKASARGQGIAAANRAAAYNIGGAGQNLVSATGQNALQQQQAAQQLQAGILGQQAQSNIAAAQQGEQLQAAQLAGQYGLQGAQAGSLTGQVGGLLGGVGGIFGGIGSAVGDIFGGFAQGGIVQKKSLSDVIYAAAGTVVQNPYNNEPGSTGAPMGYSKNPTGYDTANNIASVANIGSGPAGQQLSQMANAYKAGNQLFDALSKNTTSGNNSLGAQQASDTAATAGGSSKGLLGFLSPITGLISPSGASASTQAALHAGSAEALPEASIVDDAAIDTALDAGAEEGLGEYAVALAASGMTAMNPLMKQKYTLASRLVPTSTTYGDVLQARRKK